MSTRLQRPLQPRPASLVLAAVLAGCGGAAQAPSEARSFIALQRDFADYRSWTHVEIGAGTPQGHLTGRRTIYLNATLATGASAYPVGTIVVKEVQTGPLASDRQLFAMAKRGGGFNAAGAVDWEFFTLATTAEGVPVITGRGLAPGGNMYDPTAPDDGTASATSCNGCHGTAAAARTDFVLASAIAPVPTAP